MVEVHLRALEKHNLINFINNTKKKKGQIMSIWELLA